MQPPPHEVTLLLQRHRSGDRTALDRLLPLVYDELKSLARARLRGEREDHTLSATALVHEAYFRLADQTRAQWQDRAHFFGLAAESMRRILVDYARAHRAAKRGYGLRPASLEDAFGLSDERAEELVALDEALDRLDRFDPRQRRIVECRYFAGLTIDETAQVLGVSASTIKQDWTMAKAWLYREMKAA